jgi:Holliday junction resolvase RusA-like endonuclease
VEKLRHKLDAEGYPYQRPRFGKGGVAHNTLKYRNYRMSISLLLKMLRIKPSDNYRALKIHFFFPYPASEPKKNREDLAPYNRKYDLDNLVKGFMDALQDSGIITDDRYICGIHAVKLFTTEKKGWIEFEID